MKNLIFINGTMGSGKTAVSQKLKILLNKSIFLDGDWCWDMVPFIVNTETKEMVLENIAFLLNNFLKCSEYENVIFCWVMHEENIIKDILKRLEPNNYKLYKFSLICSKEELKKRIMKDVESGIRDESVLERSYVKMNNYKMMDTIKIDTDKISVEEIVVQIEQLIKKLAKEL
ncbi:AAA family ATPase [Fusobacterium sp. THCT1E2]